MSRIIEPRKRHENVVYRLEYHYKDDPYAGYSFDCNEQGIPELKNEAARENYRDCVEGKVDVIYCGQKRYVDFWIEPALLECNCGGEVELYGFTNTCDKCGRDYNQSGQLLAPRSQWGEETGESLSDILSIQ